MIRMPERIAYRAWLSTALFAAAALFVTEASAQAPTDAQRAAIKSQCRSDYIAHCSSVPPGGMASLQCLEKNMSSLSAGCADAVRAVQAPVTPKAEAPKPEAAPAAASTESAPPASAPPAAQAEPAAPAATTPAPKAATTAASKSAASGAAKKPSQAQIAAIRSACRDDYPNVCAGVPTGGAAALQCLAKNQAKLSATCGKAVAAVSGGGTSATAATAPAAGGASAPAIVLRPMRPREELMVLRSACGADVRSLCGGVAPGGGRIAQCLASNAASLSPACREVLAQFAAR
jgi:hypothetical protein